MAVLISLLLATSVFSSAVLGQVLIGSPLSSSPSSASPKCSSGSPGTLTVQGNGQSDATADQAEVLLSIAILNSTADGARIVAAGYANNVISAVKQIPGIFPENVTTTSISVTPATSYNSNDGTSRTIGYTYTNGLSIQIGNLTGDLLSKVLDTAVQNGGNNLTISSVSFNLSPALSYNKTVEARNQAAMDAKTTAAQFSQDFGVNLGALLSVTDQSTGGTPVQPLMQKNTLSLSAAAASSSPTPVSIGKSNVDTQITVVYTICTPLSR